MSADRAYLAVDGDDVGRALEYCVLLDQVDRLATLSKRFDSAVTALRDELIGSFEAQIFMAGGDSLLASLPGASSPTTTRWTPRGQPNARSTT